MTHRELLIVVPARLQAVRKHLKMASDYLDAGHTSNALPWLRMALPELECAIRDLGRL